MSVSKKDILTNLYSLHNTVEQEKKRLKEISEDIAYQIKLYIRDTGLTREEWCKKNGTDYTDFENVLVSEDFAKLSLLLEIILGKKNTLDLSNSSTNSALTRITKAYKEQDPEKMWAAISYYILTNFKKIQTFTEKFTEAGFEIKYSTFRTDKYNKTLQTAEKYIALIQAYEENKN